MGTLRIVLENVLVDLKTTNLATLNVGSQITRMRKRLIRVIGEQLSVAICKQSLIVTERIINW